MNDEKPTRPMCVMRGASLQRSMLGIDNLVRDVSHFVEMKRRMCRKIATKRNRREQRTTIATHKKPFTKAEAVCIFVIAEMQVPNAQPHFIKIVSNKNYFYLQPSPTHNN